MKISVGNLVEFVYRSGDICFEFKGAARGNIGIKGHQQIQKSRGEGYQAEVAVSYVYEREGYRLDIGGRIDGVWQTSEGLVLEEIKTTTTSLTESISEGLFIHWAQIKTYAYIYMLQHSLTEIGIQLTYYDVNTKDIKDFRLSYSLQDAELFFFDLIDKYFAFLVSLEERKVRRNMSIKSMDFPFAEYRKGQREFAVATYKAIERGERLFVQAATGIGKTIAVLFPVMKSISEGMCDKIFYLTAKTVGKSVAEQCFLLLMANGLNSLSVTITAKEKICFSPEASCHPDECPYAKGYYDRVKTAINEGLSLNLLNREAIVDLAKKHAICPFELSLDLSLFVDVVICDYNYAFDPRVYLRRFFAEIQEEYVFLIDEAHNLVDRSREMFSATLNKSSFLELKKLVKGKAEKIHRSLGELNRLCVGWRKELKSETARFDAAREVPVELLRELRKFCSFVDALMITGTDHDFKDQLIDLYFEAQSFIRISELFDSHFVFYLELLPQNDLKLKIYCLDPSEVMRQNLCRAKASILFSATLTPTRYFCELLGGSEDDRQWQIPSPFPIENRSIAVCREIVTLYKKREESLPDVVDYITKTIAAKQGNYLVYFPSFTYMNKALELWKSNVANDWNVVVQERGMPEEERLDFLNTFLTDNLTTHIGFAVMGGVFGEGIDLVGNRLIGVIVVGVGLPQVSMEQELIRDYFEQKNNQGFRFAYQYPGINRVLQAAGRVIRTDEDRGVIVLMDQRFMFNGYSSLLPKEWADRETITSVESLDKLLKRFWDNRSDDL
jgi:DNA excision repair protein ERCC-2